MYRHHNGNGKQYFGAWCYSIINTIGMQREYGFHHDYSNRFRSFSIQY